MRLQGIAAPDPAKGLDLVISPLVLSFPVQLMVRFLLTGLRCTMRTAQIQGATGRALEAHHSLCKRI